MAEIKIGDKVARKSYGYDLIFKVADIKDKKSIILKGVDYRLQADAPDSDLKVVSQAELDRINSEIESLVLRKSNRSKKENSSRGKGVLNRRTVEASKVKGKVLHIEGAKDFISKSIKFYKDAEINAAVFEIPEKEQPEKIRGLLNQNKPDILVITGHDGMLKGKTDYSSLESYRNSGYFVNSVKEARSYEKSMDDLVIFAGACQSNYEEILKAGANFSSSPKRILIHMLDPIIVAKNIASAGIDKVLSADEVVEDTNTGFDGIGGLQTRGKARLCTPKLS